MDRLRVLTGMLGVAVGTALVIGGLPALRAGGRLAVVAAPVLLILVGVLALLRTLAPSAAWAGPILLIAAGLIWLALRAGTPDLPQYRVLAIGLIAVGVAIALLPARRPHGLRALFATATALVLPRRPPVQLPLRRLQARAVLTQLTVDLTPDSAGKGDGRKLDVDVHVLGGRVVLIVPPTWTVEPGSIGATYGVGFSGLIDEPAATNEQGTTIDPPARTRLILNAAGLAGTVALVRSG